MADLGVLDRVFISMAAGRRQQDACVCLLRNTDLVRQMDIAGRLVEFPDGSQFVRKRRESSRTCQNILEEWLWLTVAGAWRRRRSVVVSSRPPRGIH